MVPLPNVNNERNIESLRRDLRTTKQRTVVRLVTLSKLFSILLTLLAIIWTSGIDCQLCEPFQLNRQVEADRCLLQFMPIYLWRMGKVLP